MIIINKNKESIEYQLSNVDNMIMTLSINANNKQNATSMTFTFKNIWNIMKKNVIKMCYFNKSIVNKIMIQEINSLTVQCHFKSTFLKFHV